MANALSRKAHCNHLKVLTRRSTLQQEIDHLNLHFTEQGSVNTLCIQPNLHDRIRKAQKEDEDIRKLMSQIGENKAPGFQVDDKETYGMRIGFLY